MKPIYTAIFFDEQTYNEMKAKAPTLEKKIEYPHVTLEFKPKELLPDSVIGQYVEMSILGEANDGKNQGFMIKLPQTVTRYHKSPNVPHVTISLDPTEGKAVDTGKLYFELTKEMIVKGRIGYYTKDGVKFSNTED